MAADSGNLPPTIVSKSPEPDFVGVKSCQSTACHGGALAAPMRRQGQIWNQQDPHSHAFATLTTNYSARIIESLDLLTKTKNHPAPTNQSCTVCHAPHGQIDSTDPHQVLLAQSGVSCEECHNSAQSWLRFHTRPETSYEQRVAKGLRDLRDPEIRAATCVACHQVISSDLLQAGHPKLEFELDGLAAQEPPHWQEKQGWFGPKAWLVGQAAALRVISHQRGLPGEDTEELQNQEKALQWLLSLLPEAQAPSFSPDQPAKSEEWSRTFAKTISQQPWTETKTKQALLALTSAAESFSTPTPDQLFRAQRLVQGLDRLSADLPTPSLKSAITHLYSLLNTPGQYNPQAFAAALSHFASLVAQ